MTRDKKLQAILRAAETHGRESEPDMEVGDLQDAFKVAWELMSDSQCDKLMNAQEIAEMLREWSSYYDELEGEEGDRKQMSEGKTQKGGRRQKPPVGTSPREAPKGQNPKDVESDDKSWPDSIWAYGVHGDLLGVTDHKFGKFHSYEPPERQKNRKVKYLRANAVREHAEEMLGIFKEIRDVLAGDGNFHNTVVAIDDYLETIFEEGSYKR